MVLDIALIFILLYGAYMGWQSGFFNQLASLVGFLVGLFVAVLCYAQLGHYLMPYLGTSITITNLVAFIILWVIVPIFLGFIANKLTVGMKALKIGFINNLLGLILGFAKFLVLMSCIFNVMYVMQLVSVDKSKDTKLYLPIKKVLGSFFERSDGPTIEIKQIEEHKDSTVWVKFNRDSAAHKASVEQP